MKKSFIITLSSPCSEKWESFKPTAQGGYCSSCSKEVIDFTRLSDQQIIDFFKNRPADTCGKFLPEQLRGYSFQHESINPGWKLWKAGFVAFILTFISKPSLAQQTSSPAKSEYHQKSGEKSEEKSSNVNDQPFVVNGAVYAADDESPLPGVTVMKAGTTLQTVTDANGRFTFPVPLTEQDSLVLMFIGFKSKVTKVNPAQELKISMETDSGVLGGFMVGGVQTTNTISFRRWWWKLKSIF